MKDTNDDRPARFVKELGRLERGQLAQLRRGLDGDRDTYWLERLFTVTGYGEASTRTKKALERLAGLYALKPRAQDEVDGDGAGDTGGTGDTGDTVAPDGAQKREVPSIGTLMAAVHLEQNRVGGRLPGDPSSTEKRFLGLLDADWEGLAHHLRQVVTLLQAQDFTPDWDRLAVDLLALGRGQESGDRIRKRWAQDFYREIGRAQVAMQKNKDRSDANDAPPVESVAATFTPDELEGDTL